MSSYKQIQAQIARLEREAQEARKIEIAAVVEKLRKSIALYGLTAADVGLDDEDRPANRQRSVPNTAAKSARRKMARAKKVRPGAGVARFRDPESRATWSGFGRIPGWLASVKDPEAFRIGAEAALPETPAPSAVESPAVVAPPKPAAKAARRPSAKAASKKAAAKGRAAPAKPAARKRIAVRSRASASEAPSPPAPPPVVDVRGDVPGAAAAGTRRAETASG